MSTLYKEIEEKTNLLYKRYGGMMTLVQLGKELGYSCPKSTRSWVREHALEGVQMGKSIRYETDQVARVIVNGRGIV